MRIASIQKVMAVQFLSTQELSRESSQDSSQESRNDTHFLIFLSELETIKISERRF